MSATSPETPPAGSAPVDRWRGPVPSTGCGAAPAGGPDDDHDHRRGLDAVSCLYCHHEGTTYQLVTGHGGGQHWGYCMAQHLRRNQLAYALDHFHNDPCCCAWNAAVTPRRRKPCHRCNLERAIANAAEVWWRGHELIDQARAALAGHTIATAPGHTTIPATEQGALL